MAEDLPYRSLRSLADGLADGSLTALALAEAILARTAALEPRLGAFISWDGDDLLRGAEESDRRRRSGQARSRWDGIPIGIKDLISVHGQPLTNGSRMLGSYVSPYDATVISRLRAAGFLPWGRLNLDEFAMGSSTEYSAFHCTANPWDLSRVPGGSSGGAAAAVAAGLAPGALGTDTGGSIRQPAALCGITGLKPTYGRVSRYGVTAFASSLDQVGPLARSVDDVAILCATIAGSDGHDATSARLAVPDLLAEAQNFRSWTIGIPPEFFGEGLQPDVERAVRAAAAFFEREGCAIRSISLPHAPLGTAVYFLTATAEAFSNLARFDGIRYGHRSRGAEDAVDIYGRSRAEGFGDEVKRRLILGAFVLSSGFQDAYYVRAQRVRTLIRRDYEKALAQVDFILTPTAATTAFPIGARNMDPLAMYLSDAYTVSTNLAGLPAISVPCGLDGQGLPIGLQLIGRPYGEGDLLAAANFFQKAHGFHLLRPGAVEEGAAEEGSS
ncbi:MAG: Asp-tRNA(Asn)/Glu-tRNA(Gln) amidotransferase subunit GatA [Puniceicoccales bacterium]|jgi:aspartyl-tRNA(Asn)/glutamyl-tRNA(Gln) amidotransferase subunit A|nr:Asp-tRNA(Asn)/Glu-tRNA(Gln) amidotransferase subunit GatA [Puniceicoccales bacterium]